jgi:single-stranded-DNA-specific exonuclease
VASKLVEQFFRPTIVLSINEGVAYGSGRSVPGFDLLAAIESCHDLLDQFGGHRQAAGLAMKEVKLLEFEKRLSLYADEQLRAEDLEQKLLIDSPLKLSGITKALLRGLSSLEPFGLGNPRPVFCAEGVEVVDGPHSIKNSHLRMTVKQGHSRFKAMAWRAINKEEHIQKSRASLDMAFSLTENTYQGNTAIELSVADVK